MWFCEKTVERDKERPKLRNKKRARTRVREREQREAENCICKSELQLEADAVSNTKKKWWCRKVHRLFNGIIWVIEIHFKQAAVTRLSRFIRNLSQIAKTVIPSAHAFPRGKDRMSQIWKYWNENRLRYCEFSPILPVLLAQ